ncbi:MAG: diacylglycerol kinase [Denitrovibrio sp.]|nr:MAG: diacylglycerol kinase [Denitrovibrio sp.]
MTLNKSKFSVFKNFSYAFHGLREVFRNETAFKIEVITFVICQVVIFSVPIVITAKAILSISVILPLLAELANSAIERTVDLVTMEYDEKAKAAKDAGSALVLLSLILTSVIWIWTAFFFIF